jgi:DNA-binding IscR family transcriptional regulator
MCDVCPTRDTWVELKHSIEKVLNRTTVQDMGFILNDPNMPPESKNGSGNG